MDAPFNWRDSPSRHPPTVPFIWKRDGRRLGPAEVLREWLLFLQTPLGLLE